MARLEFLPVYFLSVHRLHFTNLHDLPLKPTSLRYEGTSVSDPWSPGMINSRQQHAVEHILISAATQSLKQIPGTPLDHSPHTSLAEIGDDVFCTDICLSA